MLDAALANSPWVVYGVGSAAASLLGFFATAALLEAVLASERLDRHLLRYASSADAPRKQLLAATRARIPLRRQLRGCARQLLGLPALLNSVGLALVMRWAAPAPTSWLPPSLAAGALQLLAMWVCGDLFLYWGHRVQHEFQPLWRFHAIHHSIDTPSPLSTLYIHPHDATLQGSLPFLLAALLVRPAPAILWAAIASRIAENTVNHSGLDSPLLNVLTLKSLPLRAPIAFHDAHHKYSNHAHGAKNYGESFVIWDHLFGTASALHGRALPEAGAAAAAAKAQ